MTDEIKGKSSSSINAKFLSHGTLECRNLEKTRNFYEQFFGFETVKTSKMSFWARLNGEHVYVVVQSNRPSEEMPFLNHNGVDVDSDEDVDQSYQTALREAETWGLTNITKPAIQHGSYSFYLYDFDGNCWEILSNPRGGYGWMFERGDQEGLGHMKRSFERPTSTQKP